MFRKKGVKYQVKIAIVSATGLPDGEVASVNWKRGDKGENTGETTRKLAFDGRITWNETVTILCTMFPSGEAPGPGAHAYDPKNVVFTLKQWKNEKPTALGKVILDLAKFASPTTTSAASAHPQTKMLPVRNSARKNLSTLNVAVSAVLIAENVDEPPSEAQKEATGAVVDPDAELDPMDDEEEVVTSPASAAPLAADGAGAGAGVSATASTSSGVLTQSPFAAAASSSVLAAAADATAAAKGKGKGRKKSGDPNSVSAAFLVQVLDTTLERDFVQPGMPKTAFLLLEHLASSQAFDVHSAAASGAVMRFLNLLAVCRKSHSWSFTAIMHWISTAVWLIREATPRFPPGSPAKEPIRVSLPGKLAEGASATPDKLLLHELRAFLYDMFLVSLERAYRDLRLSVQSMADPASSGAASGVNLAASTASFREGVTRPRLTVLSVFSHAHQAMYESRITDSVRAQYFTQLCHFVNVSLMGLISSAPELCTCGTGLHIKLELSRLDEWLARDTPLLAAKVRLEQIREAANLLVMNKDILLDEATTRQTFPALSWAQIHKILSSLAPDEFAKEKTDQTVVRSVLARAQKSPATLPGYSEDPYFLFLDT